MDAEASRIFLPVRDYTLSRSAVRVA